jgi:hypothetical protein
MHVASLGCETSNPTLLFTGGERNYSSSILIKVV